MRKLDGMGGFTLLAVRTTMMVFKKDNCARGGYIGMVITTSMTSAEDLPNRISRILEIQPLKGHFGAFQSVLLICNLKLDM